MDLKLSEATTVMRCAIAKAEEIGIVASVAVCGPDGRLVAFSKMDEAGCMTVRPAIGKAVASAISGENSEVMPGRDDLTGTRTVVGEGMAPFHEQGGLALVREAVQVGAIGVYGGGACEKDLLCATAGVASFKP